MNFQDNLEKVGDLSVVLSFISIREITLYFLVHYKNMEHLNFFILLLFFLIEYSFFLCRPAGKISSHLPARRLGTGLRPGLGLFRLLVRYAFVFEIHWANLILFRGITKVWNTNK